MTTSTSAIASRGPAADPKYLPCTHPSNPYNFSPPMLVGSKLSPKVTQTHIFFLGHEGADPHVCFSQWFPAPFPAAAEPFTFNSDDSVKYFSYQPGNNGVDFPTAEHAMMYAKACLFRDSSVASQILDPVNAHPSRAKALGRQVKNFDSKLWGEWADKVVEELNVAKFGAEGNTDLREVLIRSGDRILVEASPEDRIWGVGFDIEHADGREDEWGSNRLGNTLMRVREKLGEKGVI